MESDRVLISVEFMGTKKFCEIRLNNLTKESFLKDGNLNFNIHSKIVLRNGCLIDQTAETGVYRSNSTYMQKQYWYKFLISVSEVAVIGENAKIKIFDHQDAEVTLQHLKGVITKFEKSVWFSLRIELMGANGDWLDTHAVQLMKVCI